MRVDQHVYVVIDVNMSLVSLGAGPINDAWLFWICSEVAIANGKTFIEIKRFCRIHLQSTNYVYAQHVCFAFEDADHYAVRFFEKIELLHDLIVIGMMVYPEVEQVVGCLGERLITREFFSELGIETCGTIRVNYLRCLDCIIKVTTQKM